MFRPLGENAANLFSVCHAGSERKKLADYLKSLDGETQVVMGRAGRYHEPAARSPYDKGIFAGAVNPKLIKDYGDNT